MKSFKILLVIFSSFFRVLPTQAWLSGPRRRCSSPRIAAKRRTTQQLAQQRRFLPSSNTAIVSRTVPITNEWNITVWEWETPAPLVEDYWSAHQDELQQHKQQSSDLLDPFGLIAWPGALVAVHELLQNQHLLQNATVLVLGSGVGLEVQGAAQLGASRVYALDVHPTTLELLQYGIPSHVSHLVTPIVFDVCSQQPLPYLNDVNVMMVADVLYNPELARQVARRCREAYDQGVDVLITDSQRLVHDFVEMIPPCSTDGNSNTSAAIAWEERRLNNFTGSGILVEQDQTYNVSARFLWMKHPDATNEII